MASMVSEVLARRWAAVESRMRSTRCESWVILSSKEGDEEGGLVSKGQARIDARLFPLSSVSENPIRMGKLGS